MSRGSGLGTGLLLIALLALNGARAELYSEGGSFAAPKPTTDNVYEQAPEYFNEPDYQDPYRAESMGAIDQERQRQRLANIVEQLRERQTTQPDGQYSAQELAQGPGVFVDGNEDEPVLNPKEPHFRNRNAEELAELRQLGEAISKMSQQGEFAGEAEQPEPVVEDDKNMAAVKKGQNEFVEFAEPRHNNRLKSVEWMEKRVPYDRENRNEGSSPFRFFAGGNVLFVAYLTICCVGVVAGTIGGVYYYNHVRANRVDDPFNEFTRYSPSGPSKDKLKKGPSPTFGQNGDDTLAYKAQLHHYQQQKQKILGNTQGQVVSDTMSDNEDDTDELEHNFSVFECPGLAPTGDVEIQNPNFVGDDKKAEQKDRVD